MKPILIPLMALLSIVGKQAEQDADFDARVEIRPIQRRGRVVVVGEAGLLSAQSALLSPRRPASTY